MHYWTSIGHLMVLSSDPETTAFPSALMVTHRMTLSWPDSYLDLSRPKAAMSHTLRYVRRMTTGRHGMAIERESVGSGRTQQALYFIITN